MKKKSISNNFTWTFRKIWEQYLVSIKNKISISVLVPIMFQKHINNLSIVQPETALVLENPILPYTKNTKMLESKHDIILFKFKFYSLKSLS